MQIIGKSIQRFDAFDRVTGRAIYPGDIDLPGQLHMKVCFAGRASARVKAIDAEKALAYPGVTAVFTAADVPVNEYGLITPDQPVLVGPSPHGKPGDDIVRFPGDQVALVVAETEEAAAVGRDLIEIEYEPLPLVDSVEAALAAGAPLVHPERARQDNVIFEQTVLHGNLAAGWAEAEVVVERDYFTSSQEHAYLQPEAGVAYIDEEGRVVEMVAGQYTHEDRRQIAHALGLPEEQVVVHYPAIGGAFGGREDMSIQIVLALAAWKLGRPVKLVWTREESIIGHHKRHPAKMHAKWGARRDGKIVAAEIDLTLDGGAYAYTSAVVLKNALLAAPGPYEIPNIKISGRVVYTNHTPNGAFRGFGAPQGIFLAEMQVNQLAEALAMDPITIRERNILREGSILPTGSVMPAGVSMPQVLERLAREAGWRRENGHWLRPELPDLPLPDAQPHTTLDRVSHRWRRGLGLAIGFKNIAYSFGYPETCTVTVELYGEEEVEYALLRYAGAEVGQGTHSAMAQVAAEALALPLAAIRLVLSDTAETQDVGSASASRLTFMAGNAVIGAAREALQQWQADRRPAVARFTYHARPTTPFDPDTGECDPHVAYGYVGQMADVVVDPETGRVHVLRLLTVNDVGQAINPQQVEGQIHGAVAQGVGWTLQENYIEKEGRVWTPSLSTYLIPTAMDVPDEMPAVIMEEADPQGPYGARGMAEMPFLPVAPALIAAIRDATGVWFDSIPLTPEKVWAGLQGK